MKQMDIRLATVEDAERLLEIKYAENSTVGTT